MENVILEYKIYYNSVDISNSFSAISYTFSTQTETETIICLQKEYEECVKYTGPFLFLFQIMTKMKIPGFLSSNFFNFKMAILFLSVWRMWCWLLRYKSPVQIDHIWFPWLFYCLIFSWWPVHAYLLSWIWDHNNIISLSGCSSSYSLLQSSLYLLYNLFIYHKLYVD